MGQCLGSAAGQVAAEASDDKFDKNKLTSSGFSSSNSSLKKGAIRPADKVVPGGEHSYTQPKRSGSGNNLARFGRKATAFILPIFGARVAANNNDGPISARRQPTFIAMQNQSQQRKRARKIKHGLSDVLSRELIILFEALDGNGNGVLEKSEAKRYLAMLDQSFGTLSGSAQKAKLDDFISSFPGDQDAGITLGAWKKKAEEMFGMNEDGIDTEQFEEEQQMALEYTRKLIDTFNKLNK